MRVRNVAAEMEAANKQAEEQLLASARREIYLATSKANFEAFINYKPVPYYGPERKL